MESLVSYRLDSSIATITMDDGKVNALSTRMFAELGRAFDQALEPGSRVRAIVLTGRTGAFSAGFDLKTLRAGGDAAAGLIRSGFELAARMLACPVPVVIACSGHAIAMGVFLVLSGDYRIGTAGPYKITANEVAIGLTMPRAAIELCRLRLVPAQLQRAVLLSELYTPDEAVEAGFLDRVVPTGELDSAARSVASLLTSLDRKAHAESKLRLRAATIEAMRAAIEADHIEFRATT